MRIFEKTTGTEKKNSVVDAGACLKNHFRSLYAPLDRKNAFTPEEKKFLFRGKCVLKKSKMKWKREEDRHDIRRII